MNEKTNESANPVLTFEGKKYLINELSNDCLLYTSDAADD